MKSIKQLFFSKKLLILLFLNVLIIGVSFVLIYLEQKELPQAHAETYYADAIGRRQTDQCNRVRLQVRESPNCNRLTRNDPGTCTATSLGTTNNTTSYTFSIEVWSNDGQPHTINYGTANNFCMSGRATYDSGSGYCTCIANPQYNNAQTLSIPSSGTRTITLNRANPYGLACGSYQMDFWINSVDGNASCTYGNNLIVGASGICETGTTCPAVTPTPTPLPTYTIDGGVYNDANRNGIKETNESLYTGGITITSSGGTVTSFPDGMYTITNLTAGTYTVSYRSLPTDYSMTYPLNGPPPSFQVTVGPGCTTNGATGALCLAGNIVDLKFGITNLKPWMQTTCGSLRMDDGITNPVSAGQTALITAANCSSPGVAYSGDSSADFGEGNVSSTDWQVGGLTYPEVYASDAIALSYDTLFAKQQHAGLTMINLSSVCTLSNCTLPANLPHGIYHASGNVSLNAYTFPANQDYVFLIDGNLLIRGAIRIPQANNSTALFSTSGNISIDRTVGVAANSTQTSIEGLYSSDGSFIVNSSGGCADLRLNIGGSVITNAGLVGGSFQNNRDLCANNATYPTVAFIQRLDFLLNAPLFIQEQDTFTSEVAP